MPNLPDAAPAVAQASWRVSSRAKLGKLRALTWRHISPCSRELSRPYRVSGKTDKRRGRTTKDLAIEREASQEHGGGSDNERVSSLKMIEAVCSLWAYVPGGIRKASSGLRNQFLFSESALSPASYVLGQNTPMIRTRISTATSAKPINRRRERRVVRSGCRHTLVPCACGVCKSSV